MMNKILILLASLAIASASERKDITVVEYWAVWNSSNQVTFMDSLNNVKVERVNTCENVDLVIKNNVIVVPTLIFYVDSTEVKRLEGDLSFTLKSTREEVQQIINELNTPPKK